MTQHSAYVWHPLHCRWKRTLSIRAKHSIYDATSTSGMTTQPLYQTSHPLYLCHHTISNDISPTFVWHHIHFCVTSYELYITSHPILMSSHYCTYDITTSIYETTSSMRETYTLNFWHHNHYLCHHTHCIDKITPTLFMTSHSPYVWHRLHCTRHHILTFWPQTTILRTSLQLYYKSCLLYLCHHTNSIDDITATICMISLPVYGRQYIHYIFDIVPTMYDNTTLGVDYTTLCICMTSFVLHKTSHPLYHTKPKSLWFHIHFRHDITPPVSEVTATVSLSSQPLHWNHTHFLFHHTHYISDIICTIYNIKSTAYVIKLFYLWQHKLDIWNHVQYAVQNIHYPCDITVTNVCHQTQCIERLTPTLCMTLHST